MNGCKRIIQGLFAAVMAVILYLLLFVADDLDFYLKKWFLIPQWKMMILGTAGIAGVYFLCKAVFWQRDQSDICINRKYTRILECLLWGMLFVLQAAFCYFTYFLTDWDAGYVLSEAYLWAASRKPEYVNSFYFSQYNNQVLIFEIFALIIRAFISLAGEPGLDRCALILIFVQCLLNTFTGCMLRHVALRLTRSQVFSIFVSLVYLVFVGLSPWLMIPYSDGMTLFVPVLTLLLYQRQRESQHKSAYAAVIGAVAVYGYLMKPQSVILTIAIGLYETARLLFAQRSREWMKRIGVMLVVIILGVGQLNHMIMNYSVLNVDRTQNLGMMHFFMLGMNEETRGTYSDMDVIESMQMPAEERSNIQFHTAIERIRKMGLQGFLELMRDKTLINFADGTFAWGINGVFYEQMIADKDAVISPFLKSVVYTYGEHYPMYSTVLQCIWLALLLGAALTLGVGKWMRKTGQEDMLYVLQLSLIGLAVFEWIFEAKARYLYIFAPLYVLMGMLGICSVLKGIRNGKQ